MSFVICIVHIGGRDRWLHVTDTRQTVQCRLMIHTGRLRPLTRFSGRSNLRQVWIWINTCCPSWIRDFTTGFPSRIPFFNTYRCICKHIPTWIRLIGVTTGHMWRREVRPKTMKTRKTRSGCGIKTVVVSHPLIRHFEGDRVSQGFRRRANTRRRTQQRRNGKGKILDLKRKSSLIRIFPFFLGFSPDVFISVWNQFWMFVRMSNCIRNYVSPFMIPALIYYLMIPELENG